MKCDERPIGLFDSGIGGLTVFGEVSRLLPQENLIYFGDTARLPYGAKSPEAIIRYSIECASFLLEKNIKLLIVACHTASALALEVLQEKLPIPVIGVVQPGFELLMQTTRNQRVAILGTTGTIASNVYQHLIQQHYPHSTIYPIACPLFVPFAEENLFKHQAAELIVNHYLDPLKNSGIDAALLACTHYPLLLDAIQKVLGPGVKILDASLTCSKQALQLLQDLHQLNGQTAEPVHRFYVTDNPARFLTLGQTFLGKNLDKQHLNLIHLPI